MANLDYPFVFKCVNCEQETTVERADARGQKPDPDSYDAIGVILQERGWRRGNLEGMIFCPTCARKAGQPV
jgi:hypothetical protein